ncbi:MAG: hypothetical protein JJU16_00250 [Alkalibacterium sp.]|nr:hypothetical protein [Alkalibacterium sp.]
MKQTHIYSAYRTPRFFWKDVGLSIMTLGVKKPDNFQEKAKIYKLVLENNTLEIFDDSKEDTSERVETVLLGEKEIEIIERKNKYYSDRFVYHMDRY